MGIFRRMPHSGDILDGVMGWRWHCAGNVDMIGGLDEMNCFQTHILCLGRNVSATLMVTSAQDSHHRFLIKSDVRNPSCKAPSEKAQGAWRGRN